MSSSKTIAKNTLFLYLRMFFNLGVSLYTSRVVLQVLGVEDFGIYNLVGGVVVLFSFLNASMSAATQRFINFEKASGVLEHVKKIFNISVVNHLLISFIVLVLAETIGVWVLNYKLNIPPERVYAANVMYQMTVITTIVDIIRVPYNGIILAYERMSYYAYLGIFETLSKLGIVYLLILFSSFDHLIFYGILYMSVSLLTNCVYYMYCRRTFPKETSFKFYKDVDKIKELFSFSGWILFGQIALVGANQGISLILNIFHGVVANAALGIANQVNGAIYNFVSNFQLAFNPQIVQSYALKDYELNKSLILGTSKYSFFLMAIISTPILYFTHSILVLWLGNHLPDYAEGFVQVIILCSLIDALAGPFWMSASAIGSIKKYNIFLTTINLCTLPVVYVLMRYGYNPVYAFYAKFIIYIIMQVFRCYFIHKYLKFNRKDFLFYLFAVSLIFIYLLALVVINNNQFAYSLVQIALGTMLLEVILLLMICTLGLSSGERVWVVNFVKSKLRI